MTLSQLVGLFLISIPFIAIFAYTVKEHGLKVAVSIFSITVAIIGFVGFGTILLMGVK